MERIELDGRHSGFINICDMFNELLRSSNFFTSHDIKMCMDSMETAKDATSFFKWLRQEFDIVISEVIPGTFTLNTIIDKGPWESYKVCTADELKTLFDTVKQLLKDNV